MIENEIQKLTAAVTQLTVTAEALLETLRHQSVATEGKGILKKIAEDLAAQSGTVVTPITSLEMQPAAEEAPKPKKVKAPKVEEPVPAPEPVKAEEPAVPAAKPAEGFTVQDIRAAAQKVLDAGKSAEIVALNKEYGVKRISEITPDLYPEIIRKLRAIHG